MKDSRGNIVIYDTDSEILEAYREQTDELRDWYNRYESGMITIDNLKDRLNDFIVWHCAMENKAI